MGEKEKPKFNVRGAKSLVDEVLGLAYFHPEDDEHKTPPIYSHFVPGKGPLVVAVGENASGKSFFRRCVQAVCKACDIECMSISAEGRRQVAYSPWLVFAYGDEDCMSTGYNSVGTVLTGINTCLKRDNKHVIFWDEPDLGMSDNCAAGVGQRIKEFVGQASDKTVASIVVSHSRALLQQLVDVDHHFLVFGKERTDTLQEWVDRPVIPRDLDQVNNEGITRFRRLSRLMKARGIKD